MSDDDRELIEVPCQCCQTWRAKAGLTNRVEAYGHRMHRPDGSILCRCLNCGATFPAWPARRSTADGSSRPAPGIRG